MNRSPWKQCRWCPKKAMSSVAPHEREAHPLLYRRAELERAIKSSQANLQFEVDKRVEYEEYTAFLRDSTGYPKIAQLVQRRLATYNSFYKYRDVPLSEWEDQVSTTQKALEEWDARVPFAPNTEGICSCTHRQLFHEDTLEGGPGACLAYHFAQSPCRKFTWVAFRDDVTGFPLKETLDAG